MDIQAEEASALGMRMTLTRGSLNMTVEEGGNAVQGAVQDADTILADCERVLSKYHDASEGSMLQVALAPLRALQRHQAADDRDRGALRKVELRHAHPSRGDAGRGRLLPREVQLHAGRLHRGLRLAERAHVGRPRHPLQRRGGRPARPPRRRRLSLPGVERGAGVGSLPHQGTGGGRRQGRPRGRRLGVQ